jgi:hypothetical protein
LIDIKPDKFVGVKITIKSNDYYLNQAATTKKSILTSDKTNSLFTISSTSKIELCGLQFNNLKPSDTSVTAPLIKISSTTTDTPELTFTKCKFERSATNAKLSHSLIELNGGKLTITSTDFSNYELLSGKSLISIKSD